MSFSQHYDWYQVKCILCDYFDCRISWDKLDTLIITRGDKKSVCAKKNNLSLEYTEAILIKLDITLDEFRVGYDKTFHT